MTFHPTSSVLARAAAPELDRLLQVLFRRYPDQEWATFARFGWRETPRGLVVTLHSLDEPEPLDLDEVASHVVIRAPYTRRTALSAEAHRLAVGVIHSHPAGYRTHPSKLDDDMDGYFAQYFADFAPGRPYVSLIFAEASGRLSATGRTFWNGEWHPVERFVCPGRVVTIGNYEMPRRLSDSALARVARLQSAFGTEAAERLAAATAAVIGAGGTGSAAIEVLARAGVGHLIIADPDVFTDSNLERMHGSEADDVSEQPPKVLLARRLIRSINPDCRITAMRGRVPQTEVVDALVQADVLIGCTDQQHSRVALSDLATRYLLPTIDCGVGLEGEEGQVSGQVIQLVRMLPADPCVYCRRMVIQKRLDQELMTEDEKDQRRIAAGEARARGGDADAYWQDLPQLNTVGYLTTAAGSMAAGYAIGWLTGRFEPPFCRLQMNLSARYLDTAEPEDRPRTECACRRMRGLADQGRADAFLSAPSHWPTPEYL